MLNSLLNEDTFVDLNKYLTTKLAAAMTKRENYLTPVADPCLPTIQVPEYMVRERQLVLDFVNKIAAHMQVPHITAQQLFEIESTIMNRWDYATMYAKKAIKLVSDPAIEKTI